MGHRYRGGKQKVPPYRVRRMGYPPEQDTREPLEHLAHAQDKLNEYLQQQVIKEAERAGDEVIRVEARKAAKETKTWKARRKRQAKS